MTSKAKELSAEALEEELIGIRRHLHRTRNCPMKNMAQQNILFLCWSGQESGS